MVRASQRRHCQLALTHISQNAYDEEEFKHATKDLINARVKSVDLTGGSDQQRQVAINEAKAEATSARLQTIAINHPDQALAMLEGNKNTLSVTDSRTGATYYDELSGRFRARGEQPTGVNAAVRHTNEAAGTYVPPPLPKLQDAIFGQESGRGANHRPVRRVRSAACRSSRRPFVSSRSPAKISTIQPTTRRSATAFWRGIISNTTAIPIARPWPIFQVPATCRRRVVRRRGCTIPTTAVRRFAEFADRRSFGEAPQNAGVMPHAPLPGNDPYALNAAAMQRVMDDPNLNENEKQYAFQYLQRSFQHAQVAAEADVKAKKDANDTAANGYVSTMMKSGASPQMLTDIANNPNLTWETKENLQRIATQDFGLESTTQYGKAYADTYKRIFLPPDDPNRINDVNDILKLGIPGQDNGLTPRGVGELGKVFMASRKDPDQAAVNQTKASLLNYAKSLLSFDQESLIPGIPPLRDQKGVQAFDGEFVPRFEAFYDAQIKAGKDPWEILTKDNVDKIAQQIRPKSQVAADRIRAEGSATGDQVDNAVPPQAPAGVSDETWTGLLKTPPTNQMTGRPTSAKVYGDAVLALQQNADNAAYKNSFNKWFGAKGAMADDLLGKLGAAPGQSAPQAAPGAPIVVPQQTSATLPQPAALPTPKAISRKCATRPWNILARRTMFALNCCSKRIHCHNCPNWAPAWNCREFRKRLPRGCRNRGRFAMCGQSVYAKARQRRNRHPIRLSAWDRISIAWTKRNSVEYAKPTRL